MAEIQAFWKLKICVLQRDSEPTNLNNSVIRASFYSNWPHIDRGSSANYFPIFAILLNFCVFLIFLEIAQKLKPLISWDTGLSKSNICVLKRNSGLKNANNSLIRYPCHSKCPCFDRRSSGDHTRHFWKFAQFSFFSVFFGIPPNIEIPYWLRNRTFKVEHMRLRKKCRT